MKDIQRKALFKSKLDKGGEVRDYDCGYCGNSFEMAVRKSGDGKSSASTQVQCPECENLLPTWED